MPFDNAALPSRPYMRLSTGELASLVEAGSADLASIAAELAHRDRKPAKLLAERVAALMVPNMAVAVVEMPAIVLPPAEVVECLHGEVVVREEVVSVERVGPAPRFRFVLGQREVARAMPGIINLKHWRDGARGVLAGVDWGQPEARARAAITVAVCRAEIKRQCGVLSSQPAAPDRIASHAAAVAKMEAEQRRKLAKPKARKAAALPPLVIARGDYTGRRMSAAECIKEGKRWRRAAEKMPPAYSFGPAFIGCSNPLREMRCLALEAAGWAIQGKPDDYTLWSNGAAWLRMGLYGAIYLGSEGWQQMPREDRQALDDAGRPLLVAHIAREEAKAALKAAKARRRLLVAHFPKHRAAMKQGEWARRALMAAKAEARAARKALTKARAAVASI